MKIVLLARRSRAYSTERIIQAARSRGHRCHAIDPEDCTLVVGGARRLGERPDALFGKTAEPEGPHPTIYYKSRRLLNVGLAIPRLGAAPNEFTISALQCFEAIGVPCLNRADPIQSARDRFRTLRTLAAAGLRVPRTLIARRPEELERKIQLLGGPPVMLRLLQGTQNVGAIVAEKEHAILSIVESFWEAGKNILLQQHHPESRGRELRAFVVGGRVIGALRRVTRVGEFRKNIHGVREATPVELPRSYRTLAIRAAELLDLAIVAVDLIEARGGPMVVEVNPTPGLEEVERATEIDVAGEVVRYAETYAAERTGRKVVAI